MCGGRGTGGSATRREPPRPAYGWPTTRGRAITPLRGGVCLLGLARRHCGPRALRVLRAACQHTATLRPGSECESLLGPARRPLLPCSPVPVPSFLSFFDPSAPLPLPRAHPGRRLGQFAPAPGPGGWVNEHPQRVIPGRWRVSLGTSMTRVICKPANGASDSSVRSVVVARRLTLPAP